MKLELDDDEFQSEWYPSSFDRTTPENQYLAHCRQIIGQDMKEQIDTHTEGDHIYTLMPNPYTILDPASNSAEEEIRRATHSPTWNLDSPFTVIGMWEDDFECCAPMGYTRNDPSHLLVLFE